MTFSVAEILAASPRDAVVALEVPDGSGAPNAGALRRLVLLGVWALVAERLQETVGTEAVRDAWKALQGWAGPLRFELHEQRTRTDTLDRVSRGLGSENQASRSWTVPRLHRDIDVYQRRLAALQAALGENR